MGHSFLFEGLQLQDEGVHTLGDVLGDGLPDLVRVEDPEDELNEKVSKKIHFKFF